MPESDRIEERRNREGDTFRWIVTETGKRYSNFDCMQRVKAADSAFSRWFSRAVKTRTSWAEAEMRGDELERLRWLLSDMQTYLAAAGRYLDELEGTDRRAERIRALREVQGRTPEEAAAFLAKADRLEAGDA
jgi:hypothetical protein